MIRHIACLAVLSAAVSSAAHGQIAMRPTPAPQMTAGNEAWYLSGEPISIDGIVYYPSGPTTHFIRHEMVQTGWVGDVPIFIRTTHEPRSIVYIPLAGGLVRPYERRRDGDLAGTVGSTAPAFPVVLPTDDARHSQPLRAPAPPTGSPVSTVGFVPGGSAADWSREAIGTAGAPPAVMPPHVSGSLQTARRPEGLNAVFVDYAGTRWFADGQAVRFDGARLQQIGDYHGFAVYREPARPDVIYVPAVDGAPGLVTRYASR